MLENARTRCQLIFKTIGFCWTQYVVCCFSGKNRHLDCTNNCKKQSMLWAIFWRIFFFRKLFFRAIFLPKIFSSCVGFVFFPLFPLFIEKRYSSIPKVVLFSSSSARISPRYKQKTSIGHLLGTAARTCEISGNLYAMKKGKSPSYRVRWPYQLHTHILFIWKLMRQNVDSTMLVTTYTTITCQM